MRNQLALARTAFWGVVSVLLNKGVIRLKLLGFWHVGDGVNPHYLRQNICTGYPPRLLCNVPDYRGMLGCFW